MKIYECMMCGVKLKHWDDMHEHLEVTKHKGYNIHQCGVDTDVQDVKPESDGQAEQHLGSVTEVWWDEMTQTVRECKPEGKKDKPSTEQAHRKVTTTVEVNITTASGNKTLVLKNAATDKEFVDWYTLFDSNAVVLFGNRNEAIFFKGKDVNWIQLTEEEVVE